MTIPVSERRIQSAEGLLAAALTWIEENPTAWDHIVGAAQRDALDGTPVRLKYYVEALRADPDLKHASREFKIPNGLTAALGRVLHEWHAEVAPYLRLKPSKLDGCSIPPRPY
jgi:hypothetical protein